MGDPPTLLIIPSLTAEPIPSGDPRLPAHASSQVGFGLTRKFHDGVLEYLRLWSAPANPAINGSASSPMPRIIVCVDPRDSTDDNLDPLILIPSSLPYTLRWSPASSSELESLLSSASVVLASLVDRHTHLAPLCRRLNVPLVFISEYSLNTRKQIIRALTRNPILRARRTFWQHSQERRNRAAVRLASGVQCNGTPTFNAYAPLNSRCLLYFDTRVSADMLVASSALESRLHHLASGQPLRLAFSGRLNLMKGADHLPLIAAEIRRLSVPFTLDICGAGLLESSIRQSIARLNLANSVRLLGVLDFQSRLMPFISSSVDLFICPHRQGDPSCTYLETLSCGVPIAGYDNEAFTGLCSLADIGWTSTMDSPIKLAHLVARLHADRQALALASRTALAFAARNTFESTMTKRVDHLRSCMRASTILSAK